MQGTAAMDPYKVRVRGRRGGGGGRAHGGPQKRGRETNACDVAALTRSRRAHVCVPGHVRVAAGTAA